MNTYIKNWTFCIYLETEVVHKYPKDDIFRVIEDYGFHGREVPMACKKKKKK